MKIIYRKLKGYKYELRSTVGVETGIEIEKDISINIHSRNFGPDEVLVGLWADSGWLFVSDDYCWDGPSGPTFDTKTFMRGSLVHDALYQLMREGKLDRKWRKRADELLREICLEDGMSRFRAWYVYHAVRWFGKKTSMPRENPRGQIVEI